MGSCLSRNPTSKYVPQHGSIGGGTTHTPLMTHGGAMVMQPAGGQTVHHMQPNWMNQQQPLSRNTLASGQPAAVSGNQHLVSQTRPNQPNQYTPNPVSLFEFWDYTKLKPTACRSGCKGLNLCLYNWTQNATFWKIAASNDVFWRWFICQDVKKCLPRNLIILNEFNGININTSQFKSVSLYCCWTFHVIMDATYVCLRELFMSIQNSNEHKNQKHK